MDIEKIREACILRKIKWSVHVAARMAERDIKRSDVINCIMNGEIIEHYINDYPYPSCLIFGYTLRNRVIHVVLGYDGENVYIVTAYYPNTDKFEADLKTRRKG